MASDVFVMACSLLMNREFFNSKLYLAPDYCLRCRLDPNTDATGDGAVADAAVTARGLGMYLGWSLPSHNFGGLR